ncbi:MAG: outer membrane protein assembly factor BamD [Deltaproteobacteria bacterium]|nr:MAG: outer membrane protein assembly factor BamD [Deltaproteobacteria bacterium]
MIVAHGLALARVFSRAGWHAGVALVLAVSLVACSAPPPRDEHSLFEEANAEFEARNFFTASGLYDELLEQYPFSDVAEIARLRVAHAYYLDGKYERAISAFNDFERLHPTSSRLPFVEYTIGMCWLDQMRARDRDKSAAENALRQFERVVSRYGDTLYGRLAAFRLSQVKEHLADHELFVGDYYARSGKKEAARARYQFILDKYPETGAARTARERLNGLAG